MEPVTLAEWIKVVRRGRGLLQGDVAKVLGTNQGTISRWESSGRIPEEADEGIAHWLGEAIEHVRQAGAVTPEMVRKNEIDRLSAQIEVLTEAIAGLVPAEPPPKQLTARPRS